MYQLYELIAPFLRARLAAPKKREIPKINLHLDLFEGSRGIVGVVLA